MQPAHTNVGPMGSWSAVPGLPGSLFKDKRLPGPGTSVPTANFGHVVELMSTLKTKEECRALADSSRLDRNR